VVEAKSSHVFAASMMTQHFNISDDPTNLELKTNFESNSIQFVAKE